LVQMWEQQIVSTFKYSIGRERQIISTQGNHDSAIITIYNHGIGFVHAGGFMTENVEYIIENIDFSMRMEDMPLTDEDKSRLLLCLNGSRDINEVLQETIQKHAMPATA